MWTSWWIFWCPWYSKTFPKHDTSTSMLNARMLFGFAKHFLCSGPDNSVFDSSVQKNHLFLKQNLFLVQASCSLDPLSDFGESCENILGFAFFLQHLAGEAKRAANTWMIQTPKQKTSHLLQQQRINNLSYSRLPLVVWRSPFLWSQFAAFILAVLLFVAFSLLLLFPFAFFLQILLLLLVSCVLEFPTFMCHLLCFYLSATAIKYERISFHPILHHPTVCKEMVVPSEDLFWLNFSSFFLIDTLIVVLTYIFFLLFGWKLI